MKVGDKVIMTKKAQRAFSTSFITGVVIRKGNYHVWVKRDGYGGHENTMWSKTWWRRMRDEDRYPIPY